MSDNSEFSRFRKIMEILQGPEGCPWDSTQTFSSLKPSIIEEAAEVVCGANVYEATGNSDNLREELGDLMMVIMLECRIAESQGMFSVDDVLHDVADKMIRRHPHVFGDGEASNTGEVLVKWEEIKKEEKAGKKVLEEQYLKDAMIESKKLIDVAMARKGYN